MNVLNVSLISILNLLFIIAVIIILYYIPNLRRKKIIKFVALNNYEFDHNFYVLKNLAEIPPDRIEIPDEIKNTRPKKYLITTLLNREYIDLKHTGIELFNYPATYFQNCILVPYRNTRIIFADYAYSSNYSSRSFMKQTIALVKTTKILPKFILRPELLIDKIKKIFDYKNINIEGYNRFSKMYYLQGDNEIEVLNFFSPALLEYLERNPQWCMYARSNYLVIYRDSKIIKVENYQTYISEVKEILDIVEV